MLRDVIRLMKGNRPYSLITGGLILSGLGTAFTTVAVYAALEKLHAAPFYYAVAFVGSVLPALLSSALVSRLSLRIPMGAFLVAVQLFGAASLVFPLIGLSSGSIYFLLVAEFLGSFASGLIYPLYQTIIRRQLKDTDINASSQLDLLAFASNIIIGQGVGILLHSIIGGTAYLIFDCATYIMAAKLIQLSYRLDGPAFAPVPQSSDAPFSWKALKPHQKRVMLISPLLALSCAPVMAVLPSHGTELGNGYVVGSIVLSPTLLLIFSRSLGQLFGPFLIGSKNFERWLGQSFVIPFCLAIYLSLYYFAFQSSSLLICFGSVFLAHVFSNVVYMLGNVGFRKGFSASEMTGAAAMNYQLSLLSISGASLLGGYLASNLGSAGPLCLGVFGILTMAFHLRRSR